MTTETRYRPGTVLIACPVTGEPVPTGFVMDPASFESATLVDNSFGPCPSCGRVHTWSKPDAWIEGEKPRSIWAGMLNVRFK